MWWCGELHLFKLEDSTARASRWIPLPRAELENALVEADNWLDGAGPDDYRETVKTLERVYGFDRIPGLSAPKGAAPQGTETNEAIDHLEEGQRCFNTVKIDEETGAIHYPDEPWREPTLVRSPYDGMVLCKRFLSHVERGDAVFQIAADAK